MVPLSLVHNLSLLASLCLLNGFLMRHFQRRGLRYSLLMGLLFGAATLVGMATPVVLKPGLIFDGRSIVLGIAGLFGGPVVAGSAAAMAAAYRLQIGGPGALMGVLVILESALLGVAGQALLQRWQGMARPLPLLGLGLAIHVVMLALMAVLPGGMGAEVWRRLGPVILIGYPIAFMLVAQAFVELERHFHTETALQASEARQRSYVDNAPDGVFIVDGGGAYLDVNPAACAMTGYARQELLTMHIPDLLHPDSLADGLAHFTRLQKQGCASGEVRFRTKDGGSGWWLLDAVRLEEGRFLGFAKDITDRKRTESALLESEERFRTVFEKGIDGMIIFTPAGEILDTNEAFARMRGYSREELRNLRLSDLDTPGTAELIPERMRRLMQGETLQVELDQVHRDGHIFQVEASASRVHSGDRPVILSFHRDITQRKQAEESLRDSEAKLQMLLDSTAEGIYGIDIEGNCTFCNPASLRLLGYASPAQLLGRNMHDLIHHSFGDGSQRPETDCRIFRAFRAGEGTHVDDEALWRADGSSFPAEYWSYPQTRDGQIVGAVVTFIDISARKRAEDAIRQSEARFRHVSASMMDIAYSCALAADGRYRIEWMIGATEPLLGRSIEEIKAARCWGALLVEEDLPRFDEHVTNLAPGESGSCELRLKRKDGSVAWFQSYARCETGSGEGGGHRLYGALVDITGRRQAEEDRRLLEAQLHQAHKLESLGGLAGGIAHDMNNVLGAILGLASANVEAQPPGSQVRTAFETIIKAADRGGKMVRGLLSFAHRTAAEERPLDLNELIEEEVRLLERTTLARIAIQLDLDRGLRPVLGDASSLTHALMNLSINAVDAMPESGTLTLRTRNLGPDQVEVCVEDTGTGMAPDVLARAVDPFFTTKEQGKGTGLGLSLVYSAVKAHQGELAIESEPGRGTSVRLRFPACTARAMAGPGTAPDRPGSTAGHSILVIDDDDLIQTSVGMLLEVLGHSVQSASSGEEALRLLEDGLRPDLVVLDMNMPGLGGAGTLPRLRSLRPDLPVLLATGRTDQTALDLVKAHPHTTLLSKPFTMEEMAATISSRMG